MSKKSILIVEDDNIIAFELQCRLEEKDYIVIGPFAYGDDAIEQLGTNKVDLILMDINIKGSIDGIQTAEIIKKKFNIPIIYLTAYADQNTLDRAKITEPFGYIIKPFEERELFTNIEMALYKHSMELKLIESEKWLHTTLKSIGDGVIATDKNACVIFMNEVAENLTGWNKEEAIGNELTVVFNIISEIDRKPAFNPVERVLKEGIILSLANHTLLINKNGKEIPIADSASPIKDDDGIISGCVLVFQDHTYKKLAEKKIFESEKKYRLIAENTTDGIITFDFNKKITYVSPSYLKQLGYNNDDEIDCNAEHLLLDIHPDDRNQIYENFYNAVINKKTNLIYSFRIKNKTEDYFWREDHATFEYDSNNDFLGAYVICRDNTSQKRDEEIILQKNIELSKLNDTNNKLFSIIAHDLRSPIGNIKQFSKMLYEEYHNTSHEDRIEFLKLLNQSSESTFLLLDNLLAWSQVQQGLIKAEIDEINLIEIISKVINLLLPLAKNKDITLINNINKNIIFKSDPTLIAIILNNLITNSIKFTIEKGFITIDETDDDNSITISVKDTGIGMDIDMINNLFILGKSVQRAGTNHEPSSGLGLMLCKDFIKLLGGKIWVESEIGKGSTFYFSLPRLCN